MPNGVLHLKLNAIIGVPVLAATSLWLAPTNESATLVVAAFTWGTLFASPDLDCDGVDMNEEMVGRVARILGEFPSRVVEYIYRIVWYPYALAMPHRGAGHLPFVGTALRMGYFYAILFLLFVIFRSIFNVMWFPDAGEFVSEHWMDMASVYVGWELASLIHIVADRVYHGDGTDHAKFYISKR